MDEKKLNRREFLKAALAAAAAVGLSHFRFLNLGGVNPVLADVCDSLADYCNPMEDLDICPDLNPNSADVCIPEMAEPDECMTGQDPDICAPMETEPDICAPPEIPDICEVPPAEPDTCVPQGNPDICPDGGPPSGDGDICNETGPQADPDECIPAVGESDGCTVSAEPDFCRDPGSGEVAHDICDPDHGDPDICMEEGRNVEDVCDPVGGDPDRDPNAIGLTSFAASSALPALGAAAAALGLAALRKRSKDEDAKESA
jgi:hypothetical protein